MIEQEVKKFVHIPQREQIQPSLIHFITSGLENQLDRDSERQGVQNKPINIILAERAEIHEDLAVYHTKIQMKLKLLRGVGELTHKDCT